MKRTWYETMDGPPLDADVFARCVAILDPIVEALLAEHPQLVVDNCEWFVHNEPEEIALAYASFACDDDGESNLRPMVAMCAPAVLKHSPQALRFAIAHELMHHLSDGRVSTPQAGDPEHDVVARMMMRAREAVVNDQVCALLGEPIPAELHDLAITGDDALGLDLCGLSCREVWDAIVGYRSRTQLAQLAASRDGALRDSADGWDDEVLDPPALACTFWEEHRGPWQPQWAGAHDALVAAQRKSVS